jgi:hypothetical protein
MPTDEQIKAILDNFAKNDKPIAGAEMDLNTGKVTKFAYHNGKRVNETAGE